jgi:hypothetical protein
MDGLHYGIGNMLGFFFKIKSNESCIFDRVGVNEIYLVPFERKKMTDFSYSKKK